MYIIYELQRTGTVHNIYVRMCASNSSLVRIGLEIAQFLIVLRIVKFLEAIFTEEARTLGS